MPQASDEAAVQTEVSFSDESPLQIMIQTQDPPGILAQVIAPRASASHAEVIAPRVSAASRMSEPYGTDAIGSYRQMTGMGVSLFKTIRGERVHVGSCRHLRDDNGYMWSSNQRLIRYDCIEKLYAGKPYQLTSLRNGFMKLHASNTCGRNPAPVEVGSFSHYLQGFIPGGRPDFFHQQYPRFEPINIHVIWGAYI